MELLLELDGHDDVEKKQDTLLLAVSTQKRKVLELGEPPDLF